MNDIGHCTSLPAELFITIINEVVDGEDLLVLATVSRSFHRISLNAYFSRSRFDPYSRNISLPLSSRPRENPRWILKGLCIYLWNVGASLDQLSYHFKYGHEKAITELLLFTRYVEKLSSIDKISLFVSPRDDDDEWRRRFIILLKTILEKSCKSIRIVTRHWVPRGGEIFPGPNPLLPLKPSNWLRNYWPIGHEPSNSTNTPRHLKEVAIKSASTFFLPFLYHMLRSNSSSITSIDFSMVHKQEGSDWATMMTDLHFPHLTHLSVVYAVIPRNPFVKFLAKHRTIQEFHYLHVRYQLNSRRRAQVKRDGFEYLETLATTPEHILHLLPPIYRMPALKTVTIQIEKRDRNFSDLERVLQCLVSCRNKIILSIQMTHKALGFGAWLSMIMQNGLGGRPESLLHCIDTLTLDNYIWDLGHDSFFSHLPAWLRLFPALTTLTLRRGTTIPDPSPWITEDVVVNTLKDACPGLDTIEWHKGSLVERNYYWSDR